MENANAGIDVLLQAARFLDENESMMARTPPPPPLPPTPPTPQLVSVVQQTVTIHAVGKKSPPPPPARLTVMNSFDIINPPMLDEGSGEVKRKPPPMAFRLGTREVHNKLEKNRRAQLKECFDQLYAQLPDAKESKKTSNLSILESARRCISGLEADQRHHELQMEMLAKEKIALQTRVTNLKRDIYTLYNVEVSVASVDALSHVPPSVDSVLRLPPSITAAESESAPSNGVKTDVVTVPTAVAAAVLPFSIPQMVQKLVMTTTSKAPAHFMGSVPPPPTLVNALVVVSTPSRPS